jgi:tetratricopeptide (TPR) repeat protein
MVSLLALLFLQAAFPGSNVPATQGLKPAPPPPSATDLTPERRADIFMARKMYRDALDLYKQLPQSSPIIWNKMGIAYHQMMELDLAKKHYERAIKLNPKYSEAVNNLGTIHYAKKSYRRAINQYRRALRLTPNSASVHSNLGTAYFARKKYKEAFEAYQQALALDPEVFEHRSSYGVLLQERSVEQRAMFSYYLAKTYAKAGMTDRALLYIRKALEEGFKDREKLHEDPEFNAMRDTPEFKELLTLAPRVL